MKRSSRSDLRPRQLSFQAIGTHWNIEFFEPVSAQAFTDLGNLISDRIERFDKTYSRFRDDSWISEIATRSGRFVLPEDAQPLFDFYRRLYDATDGKVTPLIGAVLSDAGYDKEYSFQPKTPSPAPAWDEVLEYRPPSLVVKRPVLLDLGAAGKGYLVDLVAELLQQEGIRNFCVNAGGDMRFITATEERLRVGLENPDDATEAIGIAEIRNQSLCGSAGNRRAWGEYHHIMDPHSLRSPRHLKAVWITAGSCMLADGLATALFFTDPGSLQEQFDFEYAAVGPDNALSMSAVFPGQFFLAENEEAK